MIYFSDITFSHACKSQNGIRGGAHFEVQSPVPRLRSPSGMSNGISSTPSGDAIALKATVEVLGR